MCWKYIDKMANTPIETETFTNPVHCCPILLLTLFLSAALVAVRDTVMMRYIFSDWSDHTVVYGCIKLWRTRYGGAIRFNTIHLICRGSDLITCCISPPIDIGMESPAYAYNNIHWVEPIFLDKYGHPQSACSISYNWMLFAPACLRPGKRGWMVAAPLYCTTCAWVIWVKCAGLSLTLYIYVYLAVHLKYLLPPNKEIFASRVIFDNGPHRWAHIWSYSYITDDYAKKIFSSRVFSNNGPHIEAKIWSYSYITGDCIILYSYKPRWQRVLISSGSCKYNCQYIWYITIVEWSVWYYDIYWVCCSAGWRGSCSHRAAHAEVFLCIPGSVRVDRVHLLDPYWYSAVWPNYTEHYGRYTFSDPSGYHLRPDRTIFYGRYGYPEEIQQIIDCFIKYTARESYGEHPVSGFFWLLKYSVYSKEPYLSV